MQPAPFAISTPQSMFSGKSVLIADDDASLLRILEARCRDLGLRVDTTADGGGTE